MHSSIIIRTLNEQRYLPELLESISTQNPGGNHEVIVVDSGSTDNTLQIAKDFGAEIVHIKREDFSFGRALNVGCEVAKSDVCVLISGHCVPADEEWLKRLTEPFAHSPKIAITYGRQHGGLETKFSEEILFRKYFPLSQQPTQEPYFCNNANAAVRKSVWERYRYDESLTGLEDMHLARSAVENGGEVKYVPDAAVFHYHHEKWGQVKRRYEREAIALRSIAPELQMRLGDALRYFFAGVLGDSAEALTQGKLHNTLSGICAFRFCQYYGGWRGNHQNRKLSRQATERYFYPR